MLGVDGEEGDGQTWVDFLREGPSDGCGSGVKQAQLAARRATMMAVDRKRRLTAHEDELSRRRSSSSTIYGQAPGGGFRRPIHPPQRTASENEVGDSGLGRSIVVDLSSPERPVPRRPSAGSTRDRRSREFVVPRWQLDSEVSKCPICGTQFSFWYRKHHCRKCGRVVCASCSPHRITIPRQFIVHPPMDASSGFATARRASIEVVDLTEEVEEDSMVSPIAGQFQADQTSPGGDRGCDSALGGGQEVRLCNPCVPDPNPLPPPTYTSTASIAQSLTPGPNSNQPQPFPLPRASLNRPLPPSLQHSRQAFLPPTPGDNQNRAEAPVQQDRWNIPDASAVGQRRRESLEAFLRRRRRRSDAIHNEDVPGDDARPLFGPPSYRRHHDPRPAAPSAIPPRYSSLYGSAPGSSVNDHQPLNQPHHARHRPHASTNTIQTPPRYRSMLDIDTPLPPPPPPPAPILREEDECPICHTALPPKGPDGSETAREQHVASCIESHFSSSTPRTSHPPPAVATAAAIAASAATPSQAGNATGTVTALGSGGDSVSSSSASAAASSLPAPHASQPAPSQHQQQHQQRPRRSAGMVIYHASEKDCVGSDGVEGQECVICFEEFAVGDEMGRLECLCKFHKVSHPSRFPRFLLGSLFKGEIWWGRVRWGGVFGGDGKMNEC
ncbi:MAG: hypothetical protein M1830_006366 [Pleopsidium flavum]|nr:MAG: hypothetical protein M1830_006366 [Pleopsidium flavum]